MSGLIYIILQFMPIFIRLCLVSACSGFDCRFTHIEPSVRRKGVDLRPNRPKMAYPRHKSQSKANPKTTRSGNMEARPSRAHHGLTVVDTTSHGDCHSYGSLSFPRGDCFLRGFRFPMQFFVCFCCYFAFKEDEFGYNKKGRFHSFSNSLTHTNSIGEIGRRKKDQAKATVWRAKIERSSLWLFNKLF